MCITSCFLLSTFRADFVINCPKVFMLLYATMVLFLAIYAVFWSFSSSGKCFINALVSLGLLQSYLITNGYIFWSVSAFVYLGRCAMAFSILFLMTLNG